MRPPTTPGGLLGPPPTSGAAPLRPAPRATDLTSARPAPAQPARSDAMKGMDLSPNRTQAQKVQNVRVHRQNEANAEHARERATAKPPVASLDDPTGLIAKAQRNIERRAAAAKADPGKGLLDPALRQRADAATQGIDPGPAAPVIDRQARERRGQLKAALKQDQPPALPDLDAETAAAQA